VQGQSEAMGWQGDCQPTQAHRRHANAALFKHLLVTLGSVSEVYLLHNCTIFLAAASLSALIGTAPAQATAPAAPDRPASSAAPATAEAKPVTRAEISSQLDSNFKMLDSNGDKVLSKTEIEAAQARSVAQAQAEVAKRIEAEFARMDTNGDGQLSLAEVKAAAPPPHIGGADEMLQKLDTNKDGRIGQDEYRAVPLANFDRLDTDKDGAVSPVEQRAASMPRNP